MKLTYNDKWSIIKKVRQRETPPANRMLLAAINLILGLSLIVCVTLLFNQTTTLVYHIAKYTSIACCLTSLYILSKDLILEWTKEQTINIFTVLFAVGHLLGLIFLLFDQYFISRILQ